MGLTRDGVTFVLDARRRGASFERTLMLGRQTMLLSADELHTVCERFGVQLEASSMLETDFAEPFLEALGATEIAALDGSAYEGAPIIHDLNEPVPAELHARFTAVIDGGTIEHVFNVPVAFANVASVLETGGHALHINPGNNYLGHGFYQFSPELYWSALPAYGLEVVRVLFKEDDGNNTWYEVADPAKLGRRVELGHGRPGHLYVLARKVSDVRGPVTQSDYVAAWNVADRPASFRDGSGAGASGIRRLVPRQLRRILRKVRSRRRRGSDPVGFRRVAL